MTETQDEFQKWMGYTKELTTKGEWGNTMKAKVSRAEKVKRFERHEDANGIPIASPSLSIYLWMLTAAVFDNFLSPLGSVCIE